LSENSNIIPLFVGKKVTHVTIHDTIGERQRERERERERETEREREREIVKAQEWWEEVENN
jgi:hypothetical protein